MALDCPVPHLHLGQDLVGERYCFDAWREAIRPVYDVKPLSDAAAGVERIDAWRTQDLIFTDVTFSKQSFTHDRRQSENADYLSLQVYRNGMSAGAVADSTFVTKPGGIHLFDFSREFHSITEASTVAGVIIPHHAIGYDPARHPAHLNYSPESAAGRFLTSVFFALLDQMPDLLNSEAAVLKEGFCGLLEAMIRPEAVADPQVAPHRTQRNEAIRSYLERNLSSPDLDADHVCRVFNMSRSSLYRDFADSGGVARYITSRRLDRAFTQLRSLPPLNGYVKDVAERCGFTDSSQFGKLFRKRFGLSPTAVMQGNTRSPTAGSLKSRTGNARSGARLADWLASI
jgi:AraC-like DNA-binding protein